MNKIEIITNSASETQRAGEILGQEITKSKPRTKQKRESGLVRGKLENEKALVIGLEGELGSGKTTFVQGLAKGLKIKERITSPTFVILKKFDLRPATHFQNFYHIDCYRFTSADQLIDLGFREIINHPENLVVIEWAERVRKILSQNTLWIKFEYLDKNKRKMTII